MPGVNGIPPRIRGRYGVVAVRTADSGGVGSS